MARIRPFRGILYNPEKVPDLRAVVTLPHDVISGQEQQAYYEAHPQNMIRLILGKVFPEDTEYNNRYTRAAQFFRSWLEEEILTQDKDPAFYVTEIDFRMNGEVRTRSGFIAVVGIEGFEKGIIRPHEKTFSATNVDRLRLIEASRANFSPIFSLFSDRDNEILGLLREAIEPLRPDLDFEDLKGYCHRLWRVTDRKIHKEIGKKLADRPVYIADGHHRYGTALEYLDRIKSRHPTLAPNDPCHFVMMYLTSMQDPGLALRPVHRVVCDVKKGTVEGFVRKACAYFDIETLDISRLDRKQIEKASLHELMTGTNSTVIGAALRDDKSFHVLRVKTGMRDRLLSQEIPEPLRKLDVTMVTKVVLEKILGLNGAALDDERSILYPSTVDEALDAVYRGGCSLALILNPTRLNEVQEVSDAGLIMPRKSTYFYPKVMDGLVINKIWDK
ncbi:MAG: DUF1015 domain-containing protein [Desulfobacterales bacterium]|nr:MAG: DUF1015 domain-containing protein [Desulfobacterales bacterium]